MGERYRVTVSATITVPPVPESEDCIVHSGFFTYKLGVVLQPGTTEREALKSAKRGKDRAVTEIESTFFQPPDKGRIERETLVEAGTVDSKGVFHFRRVVSHAIYGEA